MSRPSVVIELATAAATIGRDLSAGGVFVAGCALELYSDCELIVRGANAREVTVPARVVFANAGGAGLELVGFGPQLRDQMAELVTATFGAALISRPPPSRAVTPMPIARTTPIAGGAPLSPSASASLPASDSASLPASDSDSDSDSDATDDDEDLDPSTSRGRIALNVHERMRNLPLVQQLKFAHTGELAERVALERIYGKTVWEALLRNPRITPPEVARISRMGTLARPTIEQIVGNGAWLQVPEIRRALLSNPRLGTDQILRVLRLMTKPELKLTTMQTAYPAAVRECARKLTKE